MTHTDASGKSYGTADDQPAGNGSHVTVFEHGTSRPGTMVNGNVY